MATVRPLLCGFSYVDFPTADCVCSTGFAVLHPKHGADGKFIFQSLFSRWLRKQYESLTSGSSYPALKSSQVAELDLLVPPLDEQREIAAVLGTWDARIGKLEALLSARTELKRGLMQQLLTGKTRFKEFRREPWRTVPIGSLFKECNRYVNWSDGEAYRFASIRRRSGGLFDRGTFHGHEVKTKLLKLLKADDFVISKRQVVHGAWAIVKKTFEGFGVSDEYDVLVNRAPTVLDMQFFN